MGQYLPLSKKSIPAARKIKIGWYRYRGTYHGFRNPGARIGETSCFVQNGAKISELPVLVRKVNDIFELYKRYNIQNRYTIAILL